MLVSEGSTQACIYSAVCMSTALDFIVTGNQPKSQTGKLSAFFIYFFLFFGMDLFKGMTLSWNIFQPYSVTIWALVHSVKWYPLLGSPAETRGG